MSVMEWPQKEQESEAQRLGLPSVEHLQALEQVCKEWPLVWHFLERDLRDRCEGEKDKWLRSTQVDELVKGRAQAYDEYAKRLGLIRRAFEEETNNE